MDEQKIREAIDQHVGGTTRRAILAELKAYDDDMFKRVIDWMKGFQNGRLASHAQRIEALEQAQKADAPAPAPAINAPSTWPEVKPEDVRIGDYCDNSLSDGAIGYVVVPPDAGGDITIVEVSDKCCHTVLPIDGASFRRPPLEKGQAVRINGGLCCAITAVDGSKCWYEHPEDGHVYAFCLYITPLEIAPSLDPRKQEN